MLVTAIFLGVMLLELSLAAIALAMARCPRRQVAFAMLGVYKRWEPRRGVAAASSSAATG